MRVARSTSPVALQNRGANEATAVEWECRDEVPERERHVHRSEPQDEEDEQRSDTRGRVHVARLEHDGETEERCADQRIGEWRNERRDRLAVWRGGVTLDVRDATKEKERESLDRNAACARGERVCHLVHGERGKEADRGSGAEDDEVDGATRDEQAIGHGEQRPRRESEREDPAPVDGDLDAGDAS